MLDQVREKHKEWVNLVDKEKMPRHWVRFNLTTRQFEIYSSEDYEKLLNFDEKNNFKKANDSLDFQDILAKYYANVDTKKEKSV